MGLCIVVNPTVHGRIPPSLRVDAIGTRTAVFDLRSVPRCFGINSASPMPLVKSLATLREFPVPEKN
jgi:hypothetical protein